MQTFKKNQLDKMLCIFPVVINRTTSDLKLREKRFQLPDHGVTDNHSALQDFFRQGVSGSGLAYVNRPHYFLSYPRFISLDMLCFSNKLLAIGRDICMSWSLFLIIG